MRLGAVFGKSTGAVLGTVMGGAAVIAVAVAVVTLRAPQDGPAGAADPAREATSDMSRRPAPTTAEEAVTAEDATDANAEEAMAMAEDAAIAEPPAPRFDQVRVAPDGSAVIAGQAPPGATVSLRLDGAEIGTAQGAAEGAFAAILSLSPADTPRILSLLARMPDGTEIAGADSVIVSPFGPRPPDAVTEADPSADPVTEVAGTEEQASPRPPTTTDQATPPEPRAALPLPPDPPTATGAPPVPPAADAPARSPAALAPERPAPEPEAPGALAARDTDPALPTTEPPAPRAPEAATPTPGAPAPDLAAPQTPGDTTPAPDVALPDAPALVVAGPDGLRVIRDDPARPPAAQTEIRIDAISYDAEGAVRLSGVGAAERRVEVLLDNAPIRSAEIGPGGRWSLELPNVDPGTYTLSVTQLTEGGEVMDRVDTPFLREDPARIAASPMLVGPGVSVITVQPGFTLWGIAEANFGEGVAYVQIFERNRDQIRDPDWIYPGQIFRLPDLPRSEAAP